MAKERAASEQAQTEYTPRARTPGLKPAIAAAAAVVVFEATVAGLYFQAVDRSDIPSFMPGAILIGIVVSFALVFFGTIIYRSYSATKGENNYLNEQIREIKASQSKGHISEKIGSFSREYSKELER
ncbi:MAG: hypothetical protein ACREIR_13640, partial [Geminicoccaceae bacterium]